MDRSRSRVRIVHQREQPGTINVSVGARPNDRMDFVTNSTPLAFSQVRPRSEMRAFIWPARLLTAETRCHLERLQGRPNRAETPSWAAITMLTCLGWSHRCSLALSTGGFPEIRTVQPTCQRDITDQCDFDRHGPIIGSQHLGRTVARVCRDRRSELRTDRPVRSIILLAARPPPESPPRRHSRSPCHRTSRSRQIFGDRTV